MRSVLIALALYFAGCAEPVSFDAERAEFSNRLETLEASDDAQTALLKKLTEQNIGQPEPGPEEPETETVERLPVSTPPVADPVSESDLYVVEWTQPNCPPCIRWEMNEKPLLDMAVRTIDIIQEPALARQYKIASTPTIQLCSRSSRKVRAKWVGYTAASTIKAKARDLKRGKRIVSRVRSRTYQPVNYSSHWSVGTARNPRQATHSEIATHLRSSHGQSVAGMSTEQLLTLHDSLHQGWR